MFKEQQAIKERRARSVNSIAKMVQARTEMLALYNELATKRLTDDGSLTPLLQAFCQALIDYTAHAHFKLYSYFAEHRERRAAVSKVASEIYPSIFNITKAILDFNDKYDSLEPGKIPDSLDVDLSALGEILADRIDLEDSLIAVFVKRNA